MSVVEDYEYLGERSSLQTTGRAAELLDLVHTYGTEATMVPVPIPVFQYSEYWTRPRSSTGTTTSMCYVLN